MTGITEKHIHVTSDSQKAKVVIKAAAELCARGKKGSRPRAEELIAKASDADEFYEIYANDIRQNNRILDMKMPALEAATDADSAGTLSGTLVLQKALEFFHVIQPAFGAMTLDFSDQPALLNQMLYTRSVGSLAVQTYNNATGGDGRPKGWDTVSAPSMTDVEIEVDEHVGVPVVFGADTLAKTLRQLFDELAPAMAYALSKYFMAKIYALFTPGNYNAYAAVTGDKVPVAYATYAKGVADFARSAIVDLNTIFNPNEVPLHDRSVLLNSAYAGQISKDPSLVTFWAAQRQPDLITEGALPKMSKFIPIEVPDFPSDNNRVGMALQKNGVVAIARPPFDYTRALPGASYGNCTMVKLPETQLTVMLVEYVNHTGGYAERRMEVAIGAKVGDKRGGLVITKQ